MTTTQSLITGNHAQQHTDLTTTNATSVVNVTDRGAHVTALHIVNDQVTNSTVQVDHFKDAATRPLWRSQDVAANNHLTLEFPSPLMLQKGEELRVTAGDANHLHVWAFMAARS